MADEVSVVHPSAKEEIHQEDINSLDESSSSFYSLSSSDDEMNREEIDAVELEALVSSSSKWVDHGLEDQEIIQSMMGGSTFEFHELEGSFDGVHAIPPEPPLDCYVISRDASPPRPPEYVKNFRSQREVIHPLL